MRGCDLYPRTRQPVVEADCRVRLRIHIGHHRSDILCGYCFSSCNPLKLILAVRLTDCWHYLSYGPVVPFVCKLPVSTISPYLNCMLFLGVCQYASMKSSY